MPFGRRSTIISLSLGLCTLGSISCSGSLSLETDRAIRDTCAFTAHAWLLAAYGPKEPSGKVFRVDIERRLRPLSRNLFRFSGRNESRKVKATLHYLGRELEQAYPAFMEACVDTYESVLDDCDLDDYAGLGDTRAKKCFDQNQKKIEADIYAYNRSFKRKQKSEGTLNRLASAIRSRDLEAVVRVIDSEPGLMSSPEFAARTDLLENLAEALDEEWVERLAKFDLGNTFRLFNELLRRDRAEVAVSLYTNYIKKRTSKAIWEVFPLVARQALAKGQIQILEFLAGESFNFGVLRFSLLKRTPFVVDLSELPQKSLEFLKAKNFRFDQLRDESGEKPLLEDILSTSAYGVGTRKKVAIQTLVHLSTAGIRLPEKSQESDESLLDLVVLSRSSGLMMAYLKQGLDVNSKDNSGYLLHQAIEGGSAEVSRLLVESGAKVGVKQFGTHGPTAAELAKKKGIELPGS